MAVVTLDASDAFGDPLRGWGRYVAELLRALPATSDGLTINPVSRRGSGPEFIWEQVGLPRAARRARSAVLHAPNCFLPLRRSCPGVVTVHDLAFETHPEDFARSTALKYRALVPRIVRSAERVICVSGFTAADVERRYGVDPERLRVTPLAPALARATAPGGASAAGAPASSGPYLLGVGDLRAKKDFATLVRAWRALRREGLSHRLVLAGLDAGEGQRLRAEAGGEPLVLTGYVDDLHLDALLARADVLVHPSRYEGFGLVLLEAMARETPVIAADATALPETGGDAALYFPAGDEAALGRQISRVLSDRALQDRMVAAGGARVRQLSWESTAALTAAVYRELT